MADALRPPYRLITLGRLALVDVHGHEEPTLATRRRKLAVLAWIALARRPSSRDRLVGMFWGERDEERARNSLSDALSHLRRVLGRAALPAYQDRVALAEDTPLTVDVAELQTAAAHGDHAQVIALYAGPFLDGVHVDEAPEFEHWRDEIRMRTDALFTRACAAMCAELAGRGEWSECATLARRWLDIEPASGEAGAYLLQALAAPGTHAARIAAVQAYGLLTERLRRDLGVVPDPAVTAIASEIARVLERDSHDVVAATPGSVHRFSTEAQSNGVDRAAVAPRPPPTVLPSPAPDVTKPGRRRTRLLAGAAGASLVVVVVVALSGNRGERTATEAPVPAASHAAAPYPRSVAVLRFRNIGGDSADQYFSDGMAEEIMQALARVDGVQVAARSASFPLSADSVDVRDIGRRLNVATILEGSVRRSGTTLRVAVRLVNAADGYALWHHAYDRGVTEAFAVQDEVARAVAAALRIQLERDDEDRGRRAATDFDTYDLYLRGRYAWWTADTEDGVRRSISYFRRALARDSTFAPAWVGLADAFLELTGSHDVPPAEVVPHARAALLRAQRLDPYLADAYASLGYLATFHERRWAEAEAAFHRALALDARHTNARLWYAWLLSARGRHDEALQQVRQARGFEPTSALLSARLATMLYFARDFEGAARQARATIEADARFWLPHRQLGEALVQMGQTAEGVASLRRAATAAPSGETRARLAYALARAGDTAAARAILDELVPTAQPGYVSPFELARVHVALGETARALQLLERAAELGASGAVLLGVEPAFDPLRGEPRFRAILQRLGLQSST